MIKKYFLTALALVISLCAVSLSVPKANAAGGYEIKIDKTYLKRAVVSETEIPLSAEIRTLQGKLVFDEEVLWNVESGGENAEITGDKIIVKNAGDFSVKATLKNYPDVFSVVDCTAYNVTFSNVTILSPLESVTVYTQPVLLVGSVEVSGLVAPDDCHYELVFSVLSGNAEIYTGNYLKITGTGKVVLECRSKYDASAKVVKEFNVSDPDEGKDAPSDTVTKQNDRVKGKTESGCGANMGGVELFVLFALAACVFAVKKLKNE